MFHNSVTFKMKIVNSDCIVNCTEVEKEVTSLTLLTSAIRIAATSRLTAAAL